MPTRSMQLAGTFVLLTLTLGTATALAQNPITVDRARSEPKYARAVAISPAVVVPATAPATVRAPRDGDRLLRIHFAINAGGSTGWTLEVRSTSGVWTSSPLGAETADLWTDDLGPSGRPPDSATVQLKGPAGSAPPQVTVDRIVVPEDHTTPQAITPPGDQSQEITKGSNRIKLWGKSIARLQFIGDDGGGYYCTAFLVSANLMLTNNHCISNDAEMTSAIAEFDYDQLGPPGETKRFKELVLHDPALDYALLRLTGPSTRAPLPLGVIPLTERKGLLIIEHPAGKPKRFSRVDCHVRGVEMPGLSPAKTDFGHFCDTEGGSSGSPIQEFPSGTVLGLHHLGFETGQPNPVNRGVKIGLVLDDIKQRKPAVRAEIATP